MAATECTIKNIFLHVIFIAVFISIPVDTGCKLNVLRAFSLRPVSTVMLLPFINSHLKVFCKKAVLTNISKFTGKYLC